MPPTRTTLVFLTAFALGCQTDHRLVGIWYTVPDSAAGGAAWSDGASGRSGAAGLAGGREVPAEAGSSGSSIRPLGAGGSPDASALTDDASASRPRDGGAEEGNEGDERGALSDAADASWDEDASRGAAEASGDDSAARPDVSVVCSCSATEQALVCGYDGLTYDLACGVTCFPAAGLRCEGPCPCGPGVQMFGCTTCREGESCIPVQMAPGITSYRCFDPTQDL